MIWVVGREEEEEISRNGRDQKDETGREAEEESNYGSNLHDNNGGAAFVTDHWMTDAK